MKIEFDKSFSKSLNKVQDSLVKNKIEQIINEFDRADSITEIKNIKKLAGFKNYYRIRIGDYRLGIESTDQNIARFIVIAHRKDIYRIFP
jgi:mRNA interferase RelE/StbE